MPTIDRPANPRPTVIQLPSFSMDMDEETSNDFSGLVAQGHKDYVKSTLRLLLPLLIDVEVITDRNGKPFILATTSEDERLPLQSLGGGMTRLFRLFVAFHRYKGGLECERLLLVEGRDESNLFDALKSHRLGVSAPMVQVVEAGGRTRFQSRILAILKDATKRGVALRAVGVVRDADTDGGAAWASVRDAVGKAGLQAPGRHGDFSDGPPDVGILIVPDAQGRGAYRDAVRPVSGRDAGRRLRRTVSHVPR